MEHDGPAADGRRRFSAALDRLEKAYLAAIRTLALVAATLLVVYAAWLAITGAYKSSRDVTAVTPAAAAVSAQDVVAVDLQRATARPAGDAADPLAAQRRFYQQVAARYYQLYRARFERYKQPADARLGEKAFADRFVRPGPRLEQIGEGLLDPVQDRRDLQALLTAMTGAAADPVTVRRLTTYRSAKRIRTTRIVRGTRQQRYCSYYGYYIDQCITYDYRSVPFSRRVEESRLPDGVVSHLDLFAAYQDRFLTLLDQRRRSSETEADRARSIILADNAEGAGRLWNATRLVGAFVVLMFLFLLVALERHQRRIAQATPSG